MRVSMKHNGLANSFDLSGRTILDQKFGERTLHAFYPMLPGDKMTVNLRPSVHCTGTFVKPYFGDIDIVYHAFKVDAFRLYRPLRSLLSRSYFNNRKTDTTKVPYFPQWFLNKLFGANQIYSSKVTLDYSSCTTIQQCYDLVANSGDFFYPEAQSGGEVYMSKTDVVIDSVTYAMPAYVYKLTPLGEVLYGIVQAMDNFKFATSFNYERDKTSVSGLYKIHLNSQDINVLPFIALADITYYFFLQHSNKNSTDLKAYLDVVTSYDDSTWNTTERNMSQIWAGSTNFQRLVREMFKYLPYIHRNGSVLTDMRALYDTSAQGDINADSRFKIDKFSDVLGLEDHVEIDQLSGAQTDLTLHQGNTVSLSGNQVALLLRMKKFANRCRVAGVASVDRFKALFGVNQVDPLAPVLLKSGSMPLNRVVTSATDGQSLGQEQSKLSPINGGFSFSVESDSLSYVFVFCQIVPKQRLYQGFGYVHSQLTANALPNSLLDGFGNRAVPFTELCWQNVPTRPHTYDNQSVAGYIPRYDEWRRGRSYILRQMQKPAMKVWHTGLDIEDLLDAYNGGMVAETDGSQYQELVDPQINRLFVDSTSRFIFCDDIQCKVLRKLTSFSQALELEDGEEQYNAFGEQSEF